MDWSIDDLARSFDLGSDDITDGWIPEGLSEFRLYFFRPLFMALLKFEFDIWGEWTPGYHITNLILHWLVVCLLYAWASHFGLERRYAFLFALLFAVYTPNQMAVNWVAGRTEILSGIFIISSVYLMGLFHRHGSVLAYATSLIAGIAAFASKENAVMLPFLHVLAAFFLYGDSNAPRTGLRKRLMAVAPFFVLLPIYFTIRAWALGGFPVPPEGYYYHSPSGEGFSAFLGLKVAHAILSLVYQLPALIIPVLVERSLLIVALMVFLATITALPIIVWLKPPQRYFLLGWVALTLAPTLPIGVNPVYFYLSSPAIVLFYVFLYRTYGNSPRRGVALTSHSLLAFTLVFGLFFCYASGVALRSMASSNRGYAEKIIFHLDKPSASDTTVVYLIDFPGRNQYLVPQIRWLAERHADKEFIVLNLSSKYVAPVVSEIRVIDRRTFDLTATDATYLTTGFATAVMNADIIDVYPGQMVSHERYELHVVEVEPVYESRRDSPAIKAVRLRLKLPHPDQMGIKTLRCRFEQPLDDPGVLFLQLTPEAVRTVTFIPE